LCRLKNLDVRLKGGVRRRVEGRRSVVRKGIGTGRVSGGLRRKCGRESQRGKMARGRRAGVKKGGLEGRKGQGVRCTVGRRGIGRRMMGVGGRMGQIRNRRCTKSVGVKSTRGGERLTMVGQGGPRAGRDMTRAADMRVDRRDFI
jgi:hypothetical protein